LRAFTLDFDESQDWRQASQEESWVRVLSGRTEFTGELRAAVIGAGVFGGFHANKYANLPGVKLIGVVDIDQAAAKKIADQHGCEVFKSIDDLTGKADVVSITVPASFHYAMARDALKAGMHVYIEKPITLDVIDADILMELAEENNSLIQVGHQERFVFAAFGLLSRRATPRRIECVRSGPFTGRAMDVSVVLDLMIHDLDLVHQVAPAPVEQTLASSRVVHGEHEDEVDAHLTLSDGCEVRLLASRIAEERKRTMMLEYSDGRVEIDFIARTITNTTKADLKSAFESSEDGLPAVADDPLGYAIGAFVTCIKTGEDAFVTGGDARRALSTALGIIEAAKVASH
jgi:predicted dehydrogenase